MPGTGLRDLAKAPTALYRRLLQCCGVIGACVPSVADRSYHRLVQKTQKHNTAVHTSSLNISVCLSVSLDVGIDAGQSGYTLEVVQDARDYADHAGRTDIGMEDVRLAVRKKQDALSAGPPTREVRLKVEKRSAEDEITNHPIVNYTRE